MMDDFKSLNSVKKITACFVDLDNTLWQGILAEGDNLKLYKDRYELLLSLHQKGIQLYVVSKNDMEDVEKAFESLEIDKTLFTWLLIGWDHKYATIQRLIDVAEIRTETAVFIDDNPLERSEVKAKIPDLHVISDKHFLDLANVQAIKTRSPQPGEEIEARKNRYRTAIKAQYKKEIFEGSDVEFFRTLNREIRIGLVPSDNLDRATRLLVETNRLNFNPGKFENYDQGLEYIHQRLKAGDRFYAIATSEGEHNLGLTGALIVSIDNNTATITDGSFSCGIIGRDFEQKSLMALINNLQEQNVSDLFLHLTKTATNVRVQKILEELGFKASSLGEAKNNLKLRFHLDISDYDTDQYDWIKLSDAPPSFDYVGHPYVIEFFENNVKPLMIENTYILNLGSARGEVLGFLQEQVRQEFEDFIQSNHIHYSKVDLQYYPEEDNFVGNAEDLEDIIKPSSQDIVIAVELLEHTQRPWKVIQEMIRVCKPGGYLFISVPSFNYPKHEYPIDLWRIGPKTLKSFFENSSFKIIELKTEGMEHQPRRSIILVQKVSEYEHTIKFPAGMLDGSRNITVYD